VPSVSYTENGRVAKIRPVVAGVPSRVAQLCVFAAVSDIRAYFALPSSLREARRSANCRRRLDIGATAYFCPEGAPSSILCGESGTSREKCPELTELVPAGSAPGCRNAGCRLRRRQGHARQPLESSRRSSDPAGSGSTRSPRTDPHPTWEEGAFGQGLAQAAGVEVEVLLHALPKSPGSRSAASSSRRRWPPSRPFLAAHGPAAHRRPTTGSTTATKSI